MNITINKLLKIVALLIVLYFLCDAISAIDTKPSKTTVLNFQKKAAIDKSEDIEEVKNIAKGYTDDIAMQHENQSSAGILNMNLLIILACIQVYLNFYNHKED